MLNEFLKRTTYCVFVLFRGLPRVRRTCSGRLEFFGVVPDEGCFPADHSDEDFWCTYATIKGSQ